MGTSLGDSLRITAADLRDKYRQLVRPQIVGVQEILFGLLNCVFILVGYFTGV